MSENHIVYDKSIRSFEGSIIDQNRYVSDRYDIYIHLTKAIDNYNLSFWMVNSQMGVAGYVQYWNYYDLNKAIKAFNLMKDKSTELIDYFNNEMVPMAVVVPYFRASLFHIDPEHKERSGNYFYNWYMLGERPVEDWRESIYGNRYPPRFVEQIQEGFNKETETISNESSGTGRNKKYMTRWAATSDISPFLCQWIEHRWKNISSPAVIKEAASSLISGNWQRFSDLEAENI